MIAEDFDPLAFVTATAPALGMRFTPERLAELAEAFALVMRVGMPALTQAVPPDAEPAPVFVA
jgi:hypothetical protein